MNKREMEEIEQMCMYIIAMVMRAEERLGLVAMSATTAMPVSLSCCCSARESAACRVAGERDLSI